MIKNETADRKRIKQQVKNFLAFGVFRTLQNLSSASLQKSFIEAV